MTDAAHCPHCDAELIAATADFAEIALECGCPSADGVSGSTFRTT